MKINRRVVLHHELYRKCYTFHLKKERNACKNTFHEKNKNRPSVA